MEIKKITDKKIIGMKGCGWWEGQPGPCPFAGVRDVAGSWRVTATTAGGWSVGVHPPVIHCGRDAGTGQGSDFTFRGLWHALPWICIFRMSVYTKIPSVFSQWSPYNQSGRWYHMCKTNRDHKNTYLSKLVLQAVVASQINFAGFQNWSSGEQKAGKDVRSWFLI